MSACETPSERRSLCRAALPVLAFLASAVLVLAICGCGSEDAAPSPPFLAVLSAFPAEMAPLLAQASIEETTEIDSRVFRSGRLGGVAVVIGLTGIGLVNATNTTRAVLERFPVTGVVVSAVAGSDQLEIGSVAVPSAWTTADGTAYGVTPEWLGLAEEIASPASASLERCTTVASAPQEPVCVERPPLIAVGGTGQSSDPFAGMPFPCQAGSGDVSGCDVETASAEVAATARATTVAASAPPIVTDMETAAIAAEATARGLSFIAFRSISDGPGDPLGLPGFPAQFFTYYHLAAQNAATATVAFLERLATRSAAP